MAKRTKEVVAHGTEASLFRERFIEPDASWPATKVRAYERGLRHATQTLERTGGTLSLQQVTKQLGVSRQTIAKKVKNGDLFTVPGSSGRRRYPALQFREGGIVPGLKKVVPALPSTHPYFILNFLTQPNDLSGDRRPMPAARAKSLRRACKSAPSAMSCAT